MAPKMTKLVFVDRSKAPLKAYSHDTIFLYDCHSGVCDCVYAAQFLFMIVILAYNKATCKAPLKAYSHDTIFFAIVIPLPVSLFVRATILVYNSLVNVTNCPLHSCH